jgi:hypothetical protein
MTIYDDAVASAMDFCREQQANGVAAFVLVLTDEARVKLACMQLPGGLIAQMLRDAANGVEEAMPERLLN